MNKLKQLFEGFNLGINLKAGAIPNALFNYLFLKLAVPGVDEHLAIIAGVAGLFGGSITELIAYVRNRDANKREK